MQFADFSPPSQPSLDQQRDALQKGLGRAWQWASSGRLAEEPLLEACLEDMRYDTQCEDSRGDWLWGLMQAVGAKERFREPLFQAFQELSDDRSADQLCQLAGHYAEDGDKPFRSRLYEIVETKPISHSPWLGEDEILQLDGEQAFLFAARVRGERLTEIEGEWDDGSLTHHAVGQFGEERVRSLLKTASDAGIQLFFETWQERKQKKPLGKGQTTRQEQMRAIAASEIIEAAQKEDRCFWFRGWGMHADEASLVEILEAVFDTVEPAIIGKLLRVFSNRSVPEFDSRLIDLCQHVDEEVRRWAFNSLTKKSDTVIRRFALEQLGIEATASVVSLFAENFEDGDENRIQAALKLPEDSFDLHSLLMDVIKVLENNSSADGSQLAVITYAATPCEICRFRAVRLLFSQCVAPAWMIEECRYDSDEESRELSEENVEPNV